ncbi:MAG TPA: hypothetical protein VHQ86_06260 [Candidatus Saccharimonadia bacterium]|jgi:hypothetical protein|nr:hypothetical protein [Candidatus Saccharimonadia bacterium]
MMLKRYATIATAACGLTLALAAPALADNVSLDTTGADSNQSVEINNSSNVVLVNTNVVSVQNVNEQQASTGDVTADSNTEVGGLSSGTASNDNSTVTTISVVNDPGLTPGLPAGGPGTGTNGGNGQNGGTPTTGAGQANGGQVLGAATGGVGGAQAILPVTGPSEPVDVSALRAAWRDPSLQAPTVALAKGSSLFTGAMLLTATLLSLLGGLGSAWYAKRREERV